MRLGIRIQSTPKRRRWVDTMIHLLYDLRVQVVEDTHFDGLIANHRRTLESFSPQDTHMLVLQDDVLPCSDLIQTAEYLISLRPNDTITLFSNRPSIDIARTRGVSWVSIPTFFMAQAYIMPVGRIVDFLEWSNKHIRDSVALDDNRMAIYHHYNDIPVFATAPSLVEHLGWRDTTIRYDETMKFLAERRMARWYIGFEKSGFSIDWKKGLSDPVIDANFQPGMFTDCVKGLV